MAHIYKKVYDDGTEEEVSLDDILRQDAKKIVVKENHLIRKVNSLRFVKLFKETNLHIAKELAECSKLLLLIPPIMMEDSRIVLDELKYHSTLSKTQFYEQMKRLKEFGIIKEIDGAVYVNPLFVTARQQIPYQLWVEFTPENTKNGLLNIVNKIIY